jgi:hypothetical protein
VADVDRLVGLRVRHEALTGVLELTVEHRGKSTGRSGEFGMTGDVGDALVSEPYLAVARSQSLQEVRTSPSAHRASFLTPSAGC